MTTLSLCEVCGELHAPWPMGRHSWRPAASCERATKQGPIAPPPVPEPEARVGRPRVYASGADRQKAYRERAKTDGAIGVGPNQVQSPPHLLAEAAQNSMDEADEIAGERAPDGLVH
jgi:hypothetical protein